MLSFAEMAFLSQGDYDVVINDYEKAKSLFGNTEVPVFQKGREKKSELNENILVFIISNASFVVVL